MTLPSFAYRQLLLAEHYIASDRSDPFTRDRVLTHLANGVASLEHKSGEHSTYAAEPYEESRSYSMNERTVEYKVIAYRNLVRP
jgi:hypothetical protein